MPGDRTQGYGEHVLAVITAVLFLKFGQTLVDKPIEILFREITCNSHYNNPSTNLIRAFRYDDPLCQVEEIENIIERGNTISLAFEDIGGLLTAYVLSRVQFRERIVMFGSLTWIIAKGLIYHKTLPKGHMELYWLLSSLVGSGRVVVEGAILGLLTDLSDEQNRARNLSWTFSAALLSYVAANIVFQALAEYSVVGCYIAAMAGIILGVTTIIHRRFFFLKTYCRQAENYRSEEEVNPDRRPPRVQILSSLTRFPSCCLLFIVAVLPPMTSLSMPSLALWISRVFPVYNAFLYLPAPLWVFPITAILVTAEIPLFEEGLARRHRNSPQHRIFPLLMASFLSILIGTLLIVSNKDGNLKSLIWGLILMGLGGGAVPLTLAMLVSHLGRRLRCRYVGRAFASVYTLQCVVRLVLGPILYTLRKPGRPAMAQLFPQFIILFTVYAAFTLSWWFQNAAFTP